MEWIKCSEQMPVHGKNVLFTSLGSVFAGNYDDGRYLQKPVGKWKWLGRVHQGEVTHWMPFPEPPTE